MKHLDRASPRLTDYPHPYRVPKFKFPKPAPAYSEHGSTHDDVPLSCATYHTPFLSPLMHSLSLSSPTSSALPDLYWHGSVSVPYEQ